MRRPCSSWKLPLGMAAASVMLALSCTPPRTVSAKTVGPGATEKLEIVDTLPPLAIALRATAAREPKDIVDAYRQYETRHRPLFATAGVPTEDLGDGLLMLIVAEARELGPALDRFSAETEPLLRQLASDTEKLVGHHPEVRVILAALRVEAPLFMGRVDGRRTLVVNARSAKLKDPRERAAHLARALFSEAHRTLVPDTPSLSPLLTEVFRTGAACLATRALVPSADEATLLAVEEQQLERLRESQELITAELLASFDSARESEVSRFFDPDLKDPLLPRGAGVFIADRLFQRLALELGSATRPLTVSSATFVAFARSSLARRPP